nr:hypothetical protein CFP56_02836 [Quercus suber]
MVNKILFWSGFGVAVRFWQMGIEMRPFFSTPWVYPIYASVGAGFGYWLQDVDTRQMRYLSETKEKLLEKRRRRAEREGIVDVHSEVQKHGEGLRPSA